jgi:AraC-like DNA-binding protein
MTGPFNEAGQIRSLTMLHSDTCRARAPAATLAVSVEDLRPLRMLAAAAGVSLADILKSVDLAPEVLEAPYAGSVSLTDYFRILERLSIATHDETCGLSTRRLLPGANGLVLSNLAGRATLYEAMKAVASAYNHLHGGVYNRVELHADCLAYIIDDSDFPYALRTDNAHVCFTMECVLIFLHGMLTLISGHELHGLLRKVHTKRTQQGTQPDYLNFWSVPIRWKSRQFALYYDLSAMSIRIAQDGPPPSSPMIYRSVIELIERQQSHTPRKRSLGERLLESFDAGIYDQAAVAKRLGLSVATLRRRLLETGQPGFRVLREQALNQAAQSLLAQRHHPREVAEELGFGDLRSFTRAFKRWNGVTPAAYAQRGGRGAAKGDRD